MSQRTKLPRGTGWLFIIVPLVALYIFRRELFYGTFGVLLCPLSMVIFYKMLKPKSGGSQRREEWHPSGMSDKEWDELNDPRGH